MKHTIETALERAVGLGYGGQYAQMKANDWVGKTDAEIEDDSAHFNQNYLRNQKYARAAAIETNPERKKYLASEGRCSSVNITAQPSTAPRSTAQ